MDDINHEQQVVLENSLAREQDFNCGKWEQNQNLSYVIFLYLNKLKFSSKLKRKKIRLFESMSLFVGTRTPTQCRSHHQKYEEKFGDAKTIINVYRNQIGPQKFKQLVKRAQSELKLKETSPKQTKETDLEYGNKNSTEKSRFEGQLNKEIQLYPIWVFFFDPNSINSINENCQPCFY